MKVPVHKTVGEVCMTCKDGERLQREFREAFDRGDTVELDFDKTRIFVTAFFNAAVASLLENYSRDELERRLKILNLPLAAKELLDDSLDNADRCYRAPNFREALDRALGNLAAWACAADIFQSTAESVCNYFPIKLHSITSIFITGCIAGR